MGCMVRISFTKDKPTSTPLDSSYGGHRAPRSPLEDRKYYPGASLAASRRPCRCRCRCCEQHHNLGSTCRSCSQCNGLVDHHRQSPVIMFSILSADRKSLGIHIRALACWIITTSCLPSLCPDCGRRHASSAGCTHNNGSSAGAMESRTDTGEWFH